MLVLIAGKYAFIGKTSVKRIAELRLAVNYVIEVGTDVITLVTPMKRHNLVNKIYQIKNY